MDLQAQVERLTAIVNQCIAISQELTHANWCTAHWEQQVEHQNRFTGCECGLWDLERALGLRAEERE